MIKYEIERMPAHQKQYAREMRDSVYKPKLKVLKCPNGHKQDAVITFKDSGKIYPTVEVNTCCAQYKALINSIR